MENTKRIAIDIYGKEVAEREDLEDIINDMLSVLPRIEEEYLVSGVRLRCSKACPSIKSIDGIDFFTNQSGTSLLSVEGMVQIKKKERRKNDKKRVCIFDDWIASNLKCI